VEDYSPYVKIDWRHCTGGSYMETVAQRVDRLEQVMIELLDRR